MKDEDFVTKTINEGNVDLQKFPASKVQQLAKKMESSKATTKHIRQVAGDLPAAQIHFMHHQCTEHPMGKYNKQKNAAKQKCKTTGPQNIKHQRNPLILEIQTSSPIDVQNMVTQCMQKASNVPQRNFSAKCVTSLDTSLQSVTRRINRHQTLLS